MEIIEIGRSTLRGGMKESIPASDIGTEGMLHANSVTQVDAVFFAWASAIRMVGAVGKKCSEDTMLHMKHGHVMVKGEFEPLGRRFAEEGENLRNVQVVGDGQTGETMSHEDGCCDWVGDIQRKVADEFEWGVGEMLDRPDVADENTIRPGIGDEFEKPLLSGFLDAGGGQENACPAM